MNPKTRPAHLLRLFPAVALLAVCVLPLAAQEKTEPSLPPPPRYLQRSPDSFLAELPPPPEAGSPAAQADLDTVLQVQRWRTPDQVQWARQVASGGPFDNADILGPWFTAQNLPRLASLFAQLDRDVHPVGSKSKKSFARLRPPQVDPGVHPVVELPYSSSYPSGHTLFLFMEAGVLAEIFPERRPELYERAGKAAWGRVIGGVHFPTDLVGGRLLAGAIVADLIKNDDFQAEVARCREEAAPFLAGPAPDRRDND